jgi:hypothetical protein
VLLFDDAGGREIETEACRISTARGWILEPQL